MRCCCSATSLGLSLHPLWLSFGLFFVAQQLSVLLDSNYAHTQTHNSPSSPCIWILSKERGKYKITTWKRKETSICLLYRRLILNRVTTTHNSPMWVHETLPHSRPSENPLSLSHTIFLHIYFLYAAPFLQMVFHIEKRWIMIRGANIGGLSMTNDIMRHFETATVISHRVDGKVRGQSSITSISYRVYILHVERRLPNYLFYLWYTT